MDEKRELLRHFLAVLAYRTQKALRDAPIDFADFEAGNQIRTPKELVRHMTSVLGYARTYFIGGYYRPKALASLGAEVARFHEMLASLSSYIETSDPLPPQISAERLLQS